MPRRGGHSQRKRGHRTRRGHKAHKRNKRARELARLKNS